VRALYAVEHQAKDSTAEERLKLRQAQSAPLLTELHERLLVWKEKLRPKHPMAEAINYALSQWRELNVFSTDGAVPIDNNVSEREMKRSCSIGRTACSSAIRVAEERRLSLPA